MEHFVNSGESISEKISKMNDNDILYINEGIYKEKIKIIKSNITIIGLGNVIISNNDYYNKIHEDNKEYLTVRTYTMLVLGDNVKIKNVTIKNECINNVVYGQCVALEILGNMFYAENVKLIGGQDTLFAGPIPKDLIIRYKDLLPKDELVYKESLQYYNNCYIEGNVDFIFGSATAIFDNTIICSTGRGYISAPSTDIESKYGFIFNNCKLINRDAPKQSVILARPWRAYGSSLFLNCIVEGEHINPLLFDSWNKADTCRMMISSTCDTSNMVDFAHELNESEKTEIKEYIFFIKNKFNL